jgi:lysophospholipase L1-like esterase
LWKLAESFPDRTCLNRGFGGSQLHDVVRYADRLVLPHRPRVIVLYAGDNDLAQKRTPEQVRDDYVAFVAKIRPTLPDAKLVWIAIKPSPKRWALKDAAIKANDLVREAQRADRHSVYVDDWGPLLGDNGTPRPEFYVKDELHLSPAGYEIWTRLVRSHLE